MRSLCVAGLACAVLFLAAPVAAQTNPQKHMAGIVEDQQPGILLRFQLIGPTEARNADPAIAAIDAALKDLFRFPGYRLMSQAAVMMERPAPNVRGGSSMATQLLNGDGETYKLTVIIDSTTTQTVRMGVTLSAVSKLGSGGPPSTMLFSTSVEVSYGRTVVLGNTQPAGTSSAANQTLILAVRAESRQGSAAEVTTGREPELFSDAKVDDLPVAVSCVPPVYPSELRANRISGSVSLRYVVGIDGKVEPETMKVVKSTNKAFEQPAINAILSCTFSPARIKHTAVRDVVDNVVRFTP